MDKKMRLRLWVLLAVIALVGMLSQLLAGGGDTCSVQRIIGDSNIYTQREIEDMMDVVEQTFRREFKGCTMTKLEYDEEYSLKQRDDWAQQYQAEEAAVLRSSFDVDSRGGDGSLNPNSSYTKWLWILTRTGSGDWILQTWGY